MLKEELLDDEFRAVCMDLVTDSQPFAVKLERVNRSEKFTLRQFADYFAPVLLGYKDEMKAFFYQKYQHDHPVYEELTYDHISPNACAH